jgi:hypothetical protein
MGDIASGAAYLEAFTPVNGLPTLKVLPGMIVDDLGDASLQDEGNIQRVLGGLFEAGVSSGGVVIMPMMLTFALGQTWPGAWWLNALVMIFVALMMVSTVPTFSIKMMTTRVKPHFMLPTLVGVGAIIAALVNAPWWTLLTFAGCYLLSLPFGIVVARKLAAQTSASEPTRPPDAGEEADAEQAALATEEGPNGRVRLIRRDQEGGS